MIWIVAALCGTFGVAAVAIASVFAFAFYMA